MEQFRFIATIKMLAWMAREAEGVRIPGLGPGSFPCLAVLIFQFSQVR